MPLDLGKICEGGISFQLMEKSIEYQPKFHSDKNVVEIFHKIGDAKSISKQSILSDLF